MGSYKTTFGIKGFNKRIPVIHFGDMTVTICFCFIKHILLNFFQQLMQMLRQLNREGTTVVMVTHSEHESRYASRIVRMLDGQIITERALEAKYA